MPLMGASYSRFEEIAIELPERVAKVAERGAELVADGARERVPVRTGRLHDAIHVEEAEQEGEFVVLGGDNEAWYGHLVEFGTAHSTAHPFMVPAAEAVSGELNAIGREELLGL